MSFRSFVKIWYEKDVRRDVLQHVMSERRSSYQDVSNEGRWLRRLRCELLDCCRSPDVSRISRRRANYSSPPSKSYLVESKIIPLPTRNKRGTCRRRKVIDVSVAQSDLGVAWIGCRRGDVLVLHVGLIGCKEHDVSLMLFISVLLIVVARGCRGCRCTPRRRNKFFSRHFCWNEEKMGLNLVRCTPADKIKR